MAIRTWTGAEDASFVTAGNWLEGFVPTTGDDVYFRETDKDLLEDLDQPSIRLASLHSEQSFLGLMGTPDNPLRIAAAVVEIGEHYGFGSPTGSPRINLDLVHVDQEAGPIVTVHDSARSSAEPYLPPVRLRTNDADARVYVRRGIVGLAAGGPAETAVLESLHVSYVTSPETDAQVIVGPGVTLDRLDKIGGIVTLRAAAAEVLNRAGELWIVGSGAVDELTVEGGLVVSTTTGLVGTLLVRGGRMDLTRSRVARTVATLKREASGVVLYDPDTITLTNPVESVGPVSLGPAGA